MKSDAFKYKGKTVWRFDYIWTDDYHWNLGQQENRGDFVGTRSDFEEYARAEEWGQGFYYWQLKKKHATAEEYADYVACL